MKVPDQAQGLDVPVSRMHHMDYGQVLVCPICDDNCVHAEIPRIFKGDDYKSPFGNRGLSIVIPFWCENEHRWLLTFNFHKGSGCGPRRQPSGAERLHE
jgi:hypothetical protein